MARLILETWVCESKTMKGVFFRSAASTVIRSIHSIFSVWKWGVVVGASFKSTTIGLNSGDPKPGPRRTSWSTALILAQTLRSYWSSDVWLFSVPGIETVQKSSIEHLPLSACLTYFPSSFASAPSPLYSLGYRGQLIPLTLSVSDALHLWSAYLAPSRVHVKLPACSCRSYGAAIDHRAALG